MSPDPIALGIPAYFDVIKRPMDLSTIANKIAAEQYAEAAGVDKDVKLMIKNCFTFNPPGTPVHTCGEQLQKFWNEKWREVLAVPEQEATEEDPALDRGGSARSRISNLITDAGTLRSTELEQLERQRAEISARIDEIHRIKADKGKQKAKPNAQSGWSGSKPSKAGGAGAQSHGGPSKPPAKLGRPAKNGGAAAGTGPGPKPKKQNGRRPSDARDYGDSDADDGMLEVPTLAQKQELADKIADANPEVLMQALDLIQRTTQLGNVSEMLGLSSSPAVPLTLRFCSQHNDEIELDIDALPNNTIAQLYNLVIKGIQPGQAVPKKKKSGPKPGGQNGHQHHGQPGPKKGSKKSGMGGRGGGGAAGKNEMEVERIKALEAELSRIRGEEEEDGGGESQSGYPCLLKRLADPVCCL
jgi:bromodomain-containing factor 1